jgi:integrase/recombinase XerD
VVYDDDPLFLTREDRPFSGQVLYHLLRRLGEKAGVENCRPHRFRHTFAIQYLRNGGDVFTLQRLLGHSSMVMVKHYLALSSADDKEAHRKASPGDRWRL